jgi:hypothetical protein
MWMTFVCMGTFLFTLGKQALENIKQINLKRLENDQYKNAWGYMYNKESNPGKKKWMKPGKKAGMQILTDNKQVAF